MGGNSRKQTIGHRYYVGLHLVLCRQADGLLEILMAAKEAWRGNLPSGRSSFSRPNLFGGDEREGGISGSFDLMSGGNTQPVNDYLASVLGPLASAYRGVVSLVMRRPYIGANTARLPTMKFKMFNVQGIHRGWYPERAVFADIGAGGSAALHIAWNASGFGVTTAQFNAQKTWLIGLVTSLPGIPIQIQRYGANGLEGLSFSDGEHTALVNWITTNTPIDEISPESDWEAAFENAPAFFAAQDQFGESFPSGALASGLPSLAGSISSESSQDGRRNVIVVLGFHDPIPSTIAPAQAILATIPGLEVFAFRMDNADVADHALIDNTPADGVPVIDSTNPQPPLFLQSELLLAWADMNPAHIIRCLWTDPMRGGIATDAEIGDSFTEAADLFWSERLGLSPRFNGTGSVEADRLDVERHADCISYRSRLTGKIEIKPIRNDYNPVDLPVLDSSIVLEWSGLEREIASETPNQLTVIYTKRENGEPASVTRTNIAGVRRSGRVIPGEPVEYPACTTEALATRLCLRDLSVQVRPLLSGQLTLSYFPPELDIGEPFILNEPKLKINNVVVRIVEVQEGDGVDNSVTVKITEDRYALPVIDAVGPSSTPPGSEAQVALPSPLRVVQETPYYLAVLDQGQQAIDDALTAEPDLGLLLATGTKATLAHRDITVGVDDGAGYQDAGVAVFVTSTLTVSALTSAGDDTLVTVVTSPALSGVTANSLALIGNELVRIDAMAENGLDVDLTIGRGCLDTVPEAHAASVPIIFLQNADPREQQFIAGETVLVKLLTNLTSRRLSLITAPEDALTFSSRAIRPYPPGRFKLDGSYDQDQPLGAAVLTWVHRDRTLQTTPIPEDHDDLGIGPEAGVTYRVQVEALNSAGGLISVVTDVNVGTATTYNWNEATVLPGGTVAVRFSVTSVRGSYESWQRPSIRATVTASPSDGALLLDTLDELDAGSQILTEDNNFLVQE